MAADGVLSRDSVLLLALETAGRAPSAAVLRGRRVLGEARARPGRTGAEALLPCVDEALGRADVALEAVEAFAVAAGPGSFTGLRVGVATVKGLAFGSERPVAAVSTLAAVAHAAPPGPEPVVALLDARRGEVYAGVFARDAAVPRMLPPPEGVYTPEELAPRLPARCLAAGDAVPLCGERLRELVGPGLALGPSDDAGARAVGLLGLELLCDGQGVSAEALVPRYVRRAEAEVKRTGERFE